MTVTGVHHVSLNVADVEAALAFYVGGLGLTVRDDRPNLPFGGAWLDAGQEQIHLIRADPPHDHGQHFAFAVDDLDAIVAALRQQSVQVSAPKPIGSGRQAFCHDPAGNRVELHEPAPPMGSSPGASATA